MVVKVHTILMTAPRAMRRLDSTLSQRGALVADRYDTVTHLCAERKSSPAAH
jgi:hypothetical protein